MNMLEPEYVAEQIVSGILTNKVNVVLPASVRYLLPLKWYVVVSPQSLCRGMKLLICLQFVAGKNVLGFNVLYYTRSAVHDDAEETRRKGKNNT